jgi:hypothetical protein
MLEIEIERWRLRDVSNERERESMSVCLRSTDRYLYKERACV